MSTYKASIIIRRPVEEVFNCVADLDTWSQWRTEIVDLKDISANPLSAALAGNLVFGLFFYATDPVSGPKTNFATSSYDNVLWSLSLKSSPGSGIFRQGEKPSSSFPRLPVHWPGP